MNRSEARLADLKKNSPPTAQASAARAQAGRSLWQDARARLIANRLAFGSLIYLLVMGAACLIGPSLTGHAFDHVYPDYVRTPASLAAYPSEAMLKPVLERIASRMRVKLDRFTVAGDLASIQVSTERAFDERGLAYFARSDLFGEARITDRLVDGHDLVIAAPLKRVHFLFGTDSNGRDLLTRTLIAGRVSLAIGLLATAVALVIGVTYGATAGYLGGRTDAFMMRFVDVLYSLPFIFFVILLVVFFGRNFILMFVAVGCIEWLDMARIVRGQTLSIKRREYVEAALALGVSTAGIVRRHIIPNTLGPVVIYMTLLVPRVILIESFLSFLGLGVQEPMTSWGGLISEGARNIEGAAYMLIFPASLLVSTLFALNFLGDGLRDALDPKQV